MFHSWSLLCDHLCLGSISVRAQVVCCSLEVRAGWRGPDGWPAMHLAFSHAPAEEITGLSDMPGHSESVCV